jgi:serine/threonine protein kinase
VVKIGDFGLAKSYILHGGTITKEGDWAGTVFYCPPEQIIAFKDAKPCTDVYAMGMTLYRLIAGEFPYHFPNRREQFEMISKGKKPRDPVDIILGEHKPTPIQKKVPDIPNNLSEAVNKAIEKDASKRFQSAEGFKKAIEEHATCR